MTVHEPTTLITDLILAALGAFLAYRLRKGELQSSAKRWWRRSIGLMAISAFAGGFYHAFAPDLSLQIEQLWWRMVLWVICGLGYSMGMSLANEFAERRVKRRWQVLLGSKFIISFALVLIWPNFLVAMLDYGTAMLAWAVAALAQKRPWRLAMLTGVALPILAGLAQQTKWTWNQAFNHNDVFHCIQAFALLAFYHGGRHLLTYQGVPQRDMVFRTECMPE